MKKAYCMRPALRHPCRRWSSLFICDADLREDGIHTFALKRLLSFIEKSYLIWYDYD